MGINLKVAPRLKTLSRLRVLHDVTSELAGSLGAQASALEIIKKGVLERQLIDDIFLYYYSTDGEGVCCVTLSIDWDKHEIYASSDEGSRFSLDPELSIAEQLAKIFPILTNHVMKMCNHYHVTTIKAHFGYRPEVWSDPQKLAETRAYLGLGPAETPKFASNLRYEEKFCADTLRELGFKVEHR